MVDAEGKVKVRGRWRRVWRIVLVVVLVAAAYGVGVGQSTLVRPPLVVGQDAVTDAESAAVAVTLEDVGGQVIPWGEIDEVSRFSVYGLPHVVLAQTPAAPRRLHGLGRLHYLSRNGTRLVVLAERQLGQDVASGEAGIRRAWLRYRLGPGTTTTGRDTDG